MKISSFVSNTVLFRAFFVAFVDRVPAFFAYNILMFIFLVMASLSAVASPRGGSARAEGGNSDGGGCVFTSVKKAPQLLDFVWTNTPLANFSKGDQIPTSQKMKLEGVQTLNFTLLPSYQLAIEKVGKWKAKNEIFASALYSALISLNMLKIQATPYYFNDFDYTLCSLRPLMEEGDSVRPIIIFTKELGLVLSVPAFNSLDPVSQAGLWIHEAIRLMQILGNYRIEESVMYGLTTTILAKAPESTSLDSTYPLPAPLQEIRRQREALDAHQTLRENERLPGVIAMGFAVQDLGRSPEERRRYILEQLDLLIRSGRISVGPVDH